MDMIMEIAGKHKIPVIDDCAHAPGAEWHGRKTGTLADISIFSFQQQKNMSTLGEGGMVTTSNKEFRDRVLSYRSLCCRIYGGSEKYLAIDEERFPMEKRYWHLQFDDVGYNYRMTDAQAAVGLIQLEKLDAMNERRRQLAAALTERLTGIPGIILPHVDERGKHVFHVYMIQLAKDAPISKTDFMWELYTGYGIKAWSHYIPIHLTQPYADRGHKAGECPVTEEVVERHVTLPIHPRLTEEALDYLAASIRRVIEGASR
jgi:dTDP-4-amino-4,6-dideoxygalactose transaminase